MKKIVERLRAWVFDDGILNQSLPTKLAAYVQDKEQRMGVFQVFQDKAGQWRWRLRAANRRTVAQSEGYTRKYDATRAVYAIGKALKPGYRIDIPE